VTVTSRIASFVVVPHVRDCAAMLGDQFPYTGFKSLLLRALDLEAEPEAPMAWLPSSRKSLLEIGWNSVEIAIITFFSRLLDKEYIA